MLKEADPDGIRVEVTLRMQGLAPLDLKSASVPILCCAIEHRACDATMDFPTLLSMNVYGARPVEGRMGAARAAVSWHGALEVGWRDVLSTMWFGLPGRLFSRFTV